jgi:CheY-like chemotaxis protein
MQQYILNMKFNVDVMATVVDDILDLNVLQMGQLALRSRPFMACAAVAAVDGVLGSLLEGSGKADRIKHTCTCSNELLRLAPHGLEGDGSRVLQIMFNLASNAARMTEEGSITVLLDVESAETVQVLPTLTPSLTLAAAPAAEADPVTLTEKTPHSATPGLGLGGGESKREEVTELRLRITVSDTGRGLDPAHIPVLLDQFSVAKSEIIQKSGGTGLGLPLIKSVVDAMKGTMHFDCAAGRPGVSVVVVLPLAVMSKAAAILPKTPGTVTPSINTTALRNSELNNWVRPKRGSAHTTSPSPSLSSSSKSRSSISVDFMGDAKDMQGSTTLESPGGEWQPSGPLRRHTKTTLRQLLLIKGVANEVKANQSSPPSPAYTIQHSTRPGMGRSISLSPSSLHVSTFSRRSERKGSPDALTLVRQPDDALDRSTTRNKHPPSVGRRDSMLGVEHFMAQWKEKNRVLVVDDVKLNCLLLRKYTEQGGYKGTLKADNGYKALQIMEKDWKEHEVGSEEPRVSIVLMDCSMPVMDGYVATKKIREFNPGVAIFAVTGNAMAHQKQKCFDCGMDDLVLKPFDKHTIVSRLDKYVRSLYPSYRTNLSSVNELSRTNKTP